MLISNVKALQLLQEHFELFELGVCKLIIFYLVSDDEHIYELHRLAQEFDRLTGANCKFIVFQQDLRQRRTLEPLNSARVSLHMDRSYQGFRDDMIGNTYDLARYFGVRGGELPCLLFFAPQEEHEIAKLHVRSNLSALLPSLRTIFLDWYQSDAQRLRADELRILASSRPSRVGKGKPSLIKRMVDGAVRDNVIPPVARALAAAVGDSPGLKIRAGKVLNRLRSEPRNPRYLSEFLEKVGLKVVVSGIEIVGDGFEDIDAWDRLFERLVSSECRREIPQITTPGDFPLSKIRDLDESAMIVHLGGSLMGGAKTVVEGIKGIMHLRRIFGPQVP